jgi:hypothetical protein
MIDGLAYGQLIAPSIFGSPVLAILPSYVEWLVKGLAVVGAGAIGGLVVGAFVRRLGKWLIFRDVPRPVLLLFRGLGGVAAGLAVWVMVSSPGGSGLFGGGGTVFGGKGGEAGTDKQTTAASRTEPGLPLTTEASRGPTLRIVMLGGTRVVGDRFYLVEGQKDAKTLGELKKLVTDQQKTAGLRNIELLIYENSVARNHPSVRNLEKWAEQNDLTITKLPTKGEIPQ